MKIQFTPIKQTNYWYLIEDSFGLFLTTQKFKYYRSSNYVISKKEMKEDIFI